MSWEEREDQTVYKVVINHEEQYSIWPADRENPLGWNDAGKTGTKEECLSYIKEVWTDMRPLSLRQKIAASESERYDSDIFLEERATRRDETMSTTYVGEIKAFGGNFAPSGWALCNGQLLPIEEHEALFSLVGTSYGGDGYATFALPNLEGRLPIHKGNDLLLGQEGLLGLAGESDVEWSAEPGYLATSFIISLFGVFPSQDNHMQTEPFLAEGRIFAFDFAPGGWASCNGQLLPINQNTALFSLLGTTYGGNGQTNFALPDLRGSIPMHTGSHMLGEKVSISSSIGDPDR